MTVVDAYGARRAAQVMQDTWGHLRAEPGVRHHGTIVFAESPFGGVRVILASEFGDAGCGPWFYQQVHDWLSDQDTEPGKLYTFTGSYREDQDGEYEWHGATAITDLPMPHSEAGQA